jgi:hypothetical protein
VVGVRRGCRALVVAVGLLGALRPASPALIAVAQLATLATLVTTLFTDSGALGVLPGPAAAGELSALVADAATQIRTEVAPVPATPAMLLLVTLAFGVTAVAVHAVTVGAAAPAAAGVLLLAVFAVPTALADDLLPTWMLVAAAAGFGLLLFARPGPLLGRRQWRPGAGGAAIVAAAIVLALGAGVVAAGVGTAGRFPSSGGAGAGRGTEIGLSPFTALRGELQEATPTELFRIAGLPRPAYLRALTLSTYVPDSGWQVRARARGTQLTGSCRRRTFRATGRASVWRTSVPRLLAAGLRRSARRSRGCPRTGGASTALRRDRVQHPPGRSRRGRRRPSCPHSTAESLRAADGGARRAWTRCSSPRTASTPGSAAIAREVTADAPTGFDRAGGAHAVVQRTRARRSPTTCRRRRATVTTPS